MIRFLALAILFLQASTAIARDSKPPNIILFVSDDHRADVLSCVGSRGKSWPPTDIGKSSWEVVATHRHRVGSRSRKSWPPTDRWG